MDFNRISVAEGSRLSRLPSSVIQRLITQKKIFHLDGFISRSSVPFLTEYGQAMRDARKKAEEQKQATQAATK